MYVIDLLVKVDTEQEKKDDIVGWQSNRDEADKDQSS